VSGTNPSDADLPVVAIDGPSGSGKSTVGRAVGRELGLAVLDTGAMYRAVTFAVLDHGADPGDADACTAVVATAELELDDDRVWLHRPGVAARDVAAEIRGPEVTAAVSAVSAHPGVREVLVERQRAWARRHGGAVVEGRDIGTVVFPEATVKVYLTADDDERARRRQRDEAAARREVEVEAVREALDRRDRHDAGRAVSPLVAAPDALLVDTTDRGVDDVVAEIVARFRARRGG
jgi:cytidylate kinase